MTYLHHNYPPFTNTIEECSGVMDALSAAESLMSRNAEGEEVRMIPPPLQLLPSRDAL